MNELPDPADSRIGILYVIDELCQLGGAERNLIRTLEHLPRSRFRPYVLTFRLDPAVEAFRSLPCPVEVYPVYNLYSYNTFRYAPRLLQWIRRERIRIVHTFFETSDLWAGVLTKFATPATLISGRRDLGIQRTWRQRLAYRRLAGMFDEVHAVSDQVREYMIAEDHLDPARVFTVPNSIDLGRVPQRGGARERARWGLPDDRPLITTVANIRHIKGIDILVHTVAKLREAHPEAVFAVAGRDLEPEYSAAVARLARDFGVSEIIRFLGPVSDPAALLAESDVFFLPSRSEGMSNALLEAMAASLPSVATAAGGNRQLIRESETGFLVPVEDSTAAAGRISQLLDAPQKALSMGQAARRVVEKEYSVEAVMRVLTGRYETALTRANPLKSRVLTGTA
jgi:glycosyltransferase involved in cell wall biosynthesis